MAEEYFLSTTPDQMNLDLQIAAEREVDGVGMGVLSNGTPFLTVRGLARMCGISHSSIVRMTAQWQETPLKPREQRIRQIIRDQGADDTVSFIAVMKDGTLHHAIPDRVCMAVLEYYAFVATSSEGNAHALNSYRTLARKGFNDFIYSQVGYNPTGSVQIAWQQFHDRVSLSYHTVPDGYFSIFKEIADLFVTLLRGGAALGTSFIPDISVGIAWAKHWKSENLEVVYGERRQYDHNYPEYFPQALSNPQPAFCYPDDALGEFRAWVRKSYVPNNMPNYLGSKIKSGHLDAKVATAAIEAFKPKQISNTKS